MEGKEKENPVSNIVSRNRCESYIWDTGCFGWSYLNQNKISIIREKMKPNTSESIHYHNISQQFFYIISGQATFILGGQEFKLMPDEGIQILPKQTHCIQNKNLEDLHFLVISTPSADNDRVHIITT
ncbi:MAG: cupin domain-containing protein [Bacteroidota bacterium]